MLQTEILRRKKQIKSKTEYSIVNNLLQKYYVP